MAWTRHGTKTLALTSLCPDRDGKMRCILIWAQPDTSQIHRSSHGEQLISRDCNERIQLFPFLTPITSTKRA